MKRNWAALVKEEVQQEYNHYFVDVFGKVTVRHNLKIGKRLYFKIFNTASDFLKLLSSIISSNSLYYILYFSNTKLLVAPER